MPKRHLPDETILAVMHQVGQKRGGPPTINQWREERPAVVHYGRRREITYELIRYRFGSWSKAWGLAGFVPPRNHSSSYDHPRLIAALQRLADDLGHVPTHQDIELADGVPDRHAYKAAFGSIKNALVAAGIEPGPKRGRLMARQRRKTATRECLRCDKPFASEGAHNRLCDGCRDKNAGTLEASVAFVNPSRARP